MSDLTCKVLILGESKVGKSSILNRFTERHFTENLPPTLGIDYKITKVMIDKTEVKLQIWDTAGQERFRSITESFYKGCQAVLLVFDLTDRDTFEKTRSWLMSIYEKAGKDVIIVLVGNKYDLKESKGVEMVPEFEVDGLAKAHNISYFLASAKEDYNIQEIFKHIARSVKDRAASSGDDGLMLGGNQGNANGSCCK
jgi:small GTP-binding protein